MSGILIGLMIGALLGPPVGIALAVWADRRAARR